MMVRLPFVFARALIALVLGASGGIVISSGAAFASACPEGTGVTVVVNDTISCDNGVAESAAANFANAGYRLTFVTSGSSAGFVCRIDGRPSNDPCRNAAPANAYWALYWSDGHSGTWNYSSVGAGGLKVPKGGWVAFVFQTSSDRTPPARTPSVTSNSSDIPNGDSQAREDVVQRTSQETSSSSTLWVGSLLALALLMGMGLTVWQRRARRS